MKTRGEIQFDFQNAINQAKKLEDLANTLERRGGVKLGDTIQRVQAAWKGESARAYLTKVQRLQEQIIQSVRDLRNIASTIRTIARRVYDAEMRALDIAQQRERG